MVKRLVEISQIQQDVNKFKREKKEKVAMTSESIQKIFEDGQAKLAAKYTTEELGKVIPSYLNNSAGLYKHRSKSIPTLPTSAAQIKLEEKHKVTNGKKFLVN